MLALITPNTIILDIVYGSMLKVHCGILDSSVIMYICDIASHTK